MLSIVEAHVEKKLLSGELHRITCLYNGYFLNDKKETQFPILCSRIWQHLAMTHCSKQKQTKAGFCSLQLP